MSVSYVVTLYNKKDFIPGMIQGLRQQQGDFERQFIFIDDESTDGSFELVKLLTQDWDNVVYLQQCNQGPASATNHAVRYAQQDYIKTLDADDILAPMATQFFLNAAKQTGAAAVFSLQDFNNLISLEEGVPVFPELEYADLEIHTVDDRRISHIFTTIAAGSSNAFYRRDAFNAVGGCDESIFIQDVSLPLRILSRYRVSYFIADIVYYPPEVPGRLMSNTAQTLHDATAALTHIITENKNIPADEKRFVARKAAGRSWKWARREQGAHYLFCPEFWCYTAMALGLPLKPLKVLQQAQKTFHKKHPIRIPVR